MPSNPKTVRDRIHAIIAGWEEHAPDATFGGLTLAQFKAKVKPSLDARDEVDLLELRLDAARVERDNADRASQVTAANVVNSAKGDPAFGENSPLYASFRYIRKDARKSGLTRGSAAAMLVSAELKAAA